MFLFWFLLDSFGLYFLMEKWSAGYSLSVFLQAQAQWMLAHCKRMMTSWTDGDVLGKLPIELLAKDMGTHKVRDILMLERFLVVLSFKFFGFGCCLWGGRRDRSLYQVGDLIEYHYWSFLSEVLFCLSNTKQKTGKEKPCFIWDHDWILLAPFCHVLLLSVSAGMDGSRCACPSPRHLGKGLNGSNTF